jgi:hypothetical protein
MNSIPRIAAGLSLLIGLHQAQAATFCISTGVQLANAIATAASNGADDDIRIVAANVSGSTSGSGSPRWYFKPTANDEDTMLTVSGGWSAGGCATQTIDPTLTVLDAEYQGPVLYIDPETATYSGKVTIRNLTMTRGRAFLDGEGSAFQWFVQGTIAAQLLVEHTAIVASQSIRPNTATVRLYQSGGGTMRFRNNLVFANATSGITSVGGVGVSVFAPAIGYITSNSIFENTATGNAGYGLAVNGVVTVSNNVVADNTTSAAGASYQAYSSSAAALSLRNNHFETSQFLGAFVETGTTSGDPQWTAVGPLRIPSDTSPLRDSGKNDASGGLAATDILGHPRIVNAVIDRGAVEADALPFSDAVFMSDFE